MPSRKINGWSKAEAKMAKKFDIDKDYVFFSKTGSAVTVFNRPDSAHKFLAFNSPALSRPLINKWGSYFVTNQVMVRNLFIAMNVAGLFIFSNLLNIQLTSKDDTRIYILNGPIFAFGLLLKYFAQLLLSQYTGPKSFDRVFKTIERVAAFCCYAAEFASAHFLLNGTSDSARNIFKNISFTVYAVSLLSAVALAVLPNIPFWFSACIYLCYFICGIIFICLVKDKTQATLASIIIVTQFLGGLCSMLVGVNDGANFKKFYTEQNKSGTEQSVNQVMQISEPDTDTYSSEDTANSERQSKPAVSAEQIVPQKQSCMTSFEVAWLHWRYKNYFGPGELGIALICISDLLMYVLLRVGASSAGV